MMATRSLQTILIVILGAGIVFASIKLSVIVIPAVLAIIIASAFAPMLHWLRKIGLSRSLAAVICLLTGLVVLGNVAWLIVTQVQSDWPELAEQAKAGFNQAVAWVQSFDFAVDVKQFEELQAQAVKFLTSANFASGAVSGVLKVGQILTSLVLMIIMLFFFLKDGDLIWGFFTRGAQGALKQKTQRVGQQSVRVLGAYVRGTATVALVDATGIGIALVLLQIPLALPLAIIVFLGSFIPIIGATIAGVLAALVALVTSGWVGALIVILVVIVIQQLEGNFLQPYVMGSALKLHPLVIILSLMAGSVLMGITGALLAVPFTAVAWGIYQAWFGAEPEPSPDEPVASPELDAAPAAAESSDPAGG